MLQELYISNLALIDKARVQFGDGLNILTGETGAGKTVIVGAVNLLLGSRADMSLIRRGSGKAEVQGLFSVPPGLKVMDEKISDLIEDEDQLIVRRILSSDGKNKCYVNDRMVTLGTLSDITRYLIDLHGQHEHQSLFKISSHIDFLDKYGGEELLGLRRQFQEKSRALRNLRQELSHLKLAERELLAKKDLLEFQINEIEKAALAPGEDIEIAKERDILRNAEKIYAALANSNSLLTENAEITPATELIAQAVDELRTISNLDQDLALMADRLNGLLIEIEDCAANLRDYSLRLDFPSGRLQEVEDRLALLSLLKKKYGSTIEEILTYKDGASRELLLCDTSSERIEKLGADIQEAEKELLEVAVLQSGRRKEVARKFAEEVRRELADLDMPSASFEVSFSREQDDGGLFVGRERVKLLLYGIDKVEFMVSANKGEPAMPLVKIASGGEISRIMLALKIVLADADEVPTLIFDEVDVGIGGKTAMAVGQKMSILSRRHQVMAVTHLPQIASFADKHFSVAKREVANRTITEVRELLSQDRIGEVARLLSGALSEVSLKHAGELIEEARKSKYELIDEKTN